MLRSSSARRVVAVSASIGVAGVLAWLPAGSASANVQAIFGVQGQASASGPCTLTAGNANPSSVTPTPFSQGHKKRAVNLNATFTDTVTPDSTDTVHMTGHYAGDLQLSKKGGNLSKAVLTGSGSVAVHAAQGNATDCDPSAMILSVFQSEFTESQKGWLYVNRVTPAKAGITELVAANVTTNKPVVFEIFQGAASHASSRGFVTPGDYQGIMAVGLTAGDVGILLKGAPKSSLSMVFHKVGSALAGTRGPGAGFVQFPGSVSCSSHKATLGWKSSAGKVASGSFLVNGKQKAADTTPRGGQKVVLNHLSSTADTTITAKLHLKSGGTATATRTYVPCKA
jgi:hypothetical protein